VAPSEPEAHATAYGSVAGRRCARGQDCYHVRKLGLSEPSPLRATYDGEVCEKCREEEPGLPTPAASSDDGSGGDHVLNTRAGAQIRSLKRDMVLELYLETGGFWEAVRKVRDRWAIEPLREVPPQVYRELLPPGLSPEPPPHSNRVELTDWYDTYESWCRDLEHVARLRIPPAYIGERFQPDWGSFISVCIWFQPTVSGEFATPKLLEYAEVGGPWETSLPLRPQDDHAGEPPMAMKPPVRFMRDPAEETRIERRYGQAVLRGAWELYIKPLGIGFDELRAQIYRAYPEIEEERSTSLSREREANTAWIRVDEPIRKDDLDTYFRMIAERQSGRPRRGRDSRDRLICVECAVLHLSHGWQPEHRRWRASHRGCYRVSGPLGSSWC
jgi:hypothetical protein